MKKLKLFYIFLLSLGITLQSISGLPAIDDSVEDSDKLLNSRYKYSFNVVDDVEQVYQKQTQQMEDGVVTGEYSWIDGAGTRHVTVYRADENGYRIIEMRQEVGAIEVDPTLQERRKPIIKENRVAIANSRTAKLFETSRSVQSTNQNRPEGRPVSKIDLATETSFDDDVELESLTVDDPAPVAAGQEFPITPRLVPPPFPASFSNPPPLLVQPPQPFFTSEPPAPTSRNITIISTTLPLPESTTTTRTPIETHTDDPSLLSDFGTRKAVRIVKRPKNSSPIRASFDRGNRKPILVIPVEKNSKILEIPVEKLKLVTTNRPSTTTRATTTTTTSTPKPTSTTTTARLDYENLDYEHGSEEFEEEDDDEVLPTFTSFTVLNNREEKSRPIVLTPTVTSAPRFIPQPVRVIPIPIHNTNFEQIPLLQNSHA